MMEIVNDTNQRDDQCNGIQTCAFRLLMSVNQQPIDGDKTRIFITGVR